MRIGPKIRVRALWTEEIQARMRLGCICHGQRTEEMGKTDDEVAE